MSVFGFHIPKRQLPFVSKAPDTDSSRFHTSISVLSFPYFGFRTSGFSTCPACNRYSHVLLSFFPLQLSMLLLLTIITMENKVCV